MVAILHGFILILSITLADYSRKFELLRMHAFPARLFNQTILRYKSETEYLAVNNDRE
jgi:hypothetical protein